MRNDFKIVLDTNTLVRGLGNRDSASGRILRLCERGDIGLLLSRPVTVEYRRVLSNEQIARRHQKINAESVELVLRRLRYFAEYIAQVRVRFNFERDPLDEKFVELAIAGLASHIVSHDKDLLSLMFEHTDSAKRFRQRLPKTRVLLPSEFMREYESF